MPIFVMLLYTPLPEIPRRHSSSNLLGHIVNKKYKMVSKYICDVIRDSLFVADKIIICGAQKVFTQV